MNEPLDDVTVDRLEGNFRKIKTFIVFSYPFIRYYTLLIVDTYKACDHINPK